VCARRCRGAGGGPASRPPSRGLSGRSATGAVWRNRARLVRYPPDPGSAVRDPEELDLLLVAAHGVLLDVADAADRPLALGDAWIELRRRLHGQQGLLI